MHWIETEGGRLVNLAFVETIDVVKRRDDNRDVWAVVAQLHEVGAQARSVLAEAHTKYPCDTPSQIRLATRDTEAAALRAYGSIMQWITVASGVAILRLMPVRSVPVDGVLSAKDAEDWRRLHEQPLISEVQDAMEGRR